MCGGIYNHRKHGLTLGVIKKYFWTTVYNYTVGYSKMKKRLKLPNSSYRLTANLAFDIIMC